MVVLSSTDPLSIENGAESLKENQAIAELLSEVAGLLESQHASVFRIRAYRAAAETVRQLLSPLRDLLEQDGNEGLIALPTIGHSIAGLIESYLRLGRMPLLDRLRGESNAEKYFTTLPGIGPEFSHRIYDHLHVETPAELYVAACQGRLREVPGLGLKRIQAIKDTLAQRLSESKAGATLCPETDRSVPVAELLAIDEEYRRKAKNDELQRVASDQSRPSDDARLPVLHTQCEGRHYTALFSNTDRTHELGQTNDWVVIYRDDANAYGRWTVITSSFGNLKGNRVILGRENECQAHYGPHDDIHFCEAGHPPYMELPQEWEREQGRLSCQG